jgi:hypothetical protein
MPRLQPMSFLSMRAKFGLRHDQSYLLGKQAIYPFRVTEGYKNHPAPRSLARQAHSMTTTGSAPGRGWPEIGTMDKPMQERRNEARRRALKRARITFKGRCGRSIVLSLICRTGAPASKWKVPSGFPIHSILGLTTHPSAVAA